VSPEHTAQVRRTMPDAGEPRVRRRQRFAAATSTAEGSEGRES
jgi:hypothetical protein